MLNKSDKKIINFYKKIHNELLKFATVGAAAFVIDTSIYNLLRYTLLQNNPLFAKVISVTISMIFAWLGNRHWTYKGRNQKSATLELTLFITLNLIGLGISLACIWVSHYIFGFNSLLADNIAGNGIGLILGTSFRFATYRLWVFPENKQPQTQPETQKQPQYAKQN